MPDITAQAPDGSKHVFPDGTDPAIIDRTMKAYITGQSQVQTPAPKFSPGAMPQGSYQTRPSGPVLNANESPLRTGVLATERGLGINNPQSLGDAMTQALKSFGGFVGKSVAEPFSNTSMTDPLMPLKAPLDAALAIPNVVARGSEGIAGSLESSIKDITQGWNRKDPRSVAAGVGEFVPAKAATVEGPDVKAAMQEVLGEGKSKAAMLGDQHAHAIETQKHIASVADKVHTDAQQAMARVSQTVDASKPEGAFDKTEVRDRVKAAMGDTLSDESQLPTSLKKITTPEKPTFAGFVNKNTQGLISRLRDGGLSDSEIGEALKQQGFRPEEVKAALSESAGTQPGRMSFEEVKQARSDLGRQKGRLQGPAQAAADLAYAELSKILREGARDVNVESDWIDANARYKNYMDDFVRSPLSKTLAGENASDIMDPLTGKSRAQVMGILGKYSPFGLDMERIGEEVKRSSVGETVTKLSRPTKMDLLMAGFSPKALAVRQLGPRIMRSSKLPLINKSPLDMIAGKGFDAPIIQPSKVFPSKAAAMKAVKGGNGPKGGINASGYEESLKPIDKATSIRSLSNEIDTMKTKLRNAGSAPMSEKKALQKQIDDYQQQLDELRGGD